MVTLGFAAADITPPVGVALTGYGYYLKRTALRVHDPLFARALALRVGDNTLLLICCDLIGFGPDFVTDLRARIEKTTSAPPRHVMVTCTHTHSGPATVFLRGLGEVDEDYLAALAEKLVDVARAAVLDSAAVSDMAHFCEPFEGIGYKRADRSNDGLDNRLHGLRIDRRARDSVLLLNYGCHPVTVGKNREVSADYPGAVVSKMGQTGYETVFLNGCCGDVDPKVNEEEWGSGTYDTVDAYADAIAAVAAKGLERAKVMAGADVAVRHFTVELPLEVPTRESLEKSLRELETADLEPQMVRFEREWLRAALTRLASGQAGETVSADVQVFDLDEVVIVGLPMEAFSVFGMRIKDALPQRNVFVVGQCNGTIGYLPTRANMEASGYANTFAAKIYDRFPLALEAEAAFTRQMTEFLGSLNPATR